MHPLVSAVMPAYNSERFISESIESVLAQTFRDFEIIVVDDGSTDHTQECVRRFGAAVILLCQANRGPSAARNLGIRASKGQYVAFLDSDDLWTVDKLERQIDFLERHNGIGMVFADQMRFNEKGVILDSFLRGTPKVRDMYGTLIKEQNELQNATAMLLQCNFIPTGSVVARRSCLEAVNGFDENLWTVEDLDLWIRLSLATKIGFVPEVLKKKREHDANISSDYLRALNADIYIVEKLQREFPEINDLYKKYYDLKLTEDFFSIGYSYFSKYELGEAKKWFTKSLLKHFTLASLIYLLSCFCPIRLIVVLKSMKKRRLLAQLFEGLWKTRRAI